MAKDLPHNGSCPQFHADWAGQHDNKRTWYVHGVGPGGKAARQTRNSKLIFTSVFTNMADVTLRIIDGASRGRAYTDMPTPITIGREDGNTIQLNDDRVSRFHVKIQEDSDKVVLVDLDSTNGTLVNGENVSLRILKFGDLLTIGRSVMLFGTREQIAERLAELRKDGVDLNALASAEGVQPSIEDAVSLDFELGWSQDDLLQATMHALEPPVLPERLQPVQAAQLAELIEYIHIRLRYLLATASQAEKDESQILLDQRPWQNLLDLQARLADYLRAIGEPR